MILTKARTGFSLIEALVVLAVGGMALAVIFTIGVKAGDTGFSIGRRAMSAADADLAGSDLRAIIRSLAVRPPDLFMEGDQPIVGEPLKLEGEVVMERGTQCAPQGWSGRLILSIEGEGAQRALICRAGARQTALMLLPRGAPSFAYSADGETWTPTYSNAPQGERSDSGVRSIRLWVRFSAAPIADIVESAGFSRPELWNRPVDIF